MRSENRRMRPRFTVLTFKHSVTRFPSRVQLDLLAALALSFRTQPPPAPCRLDGVRNTKVTKWAEGPCATFGPLS